MLRIVTRASLLALAGAAIAWGVAALPTFWRQSALERTAAHVLAGDPFKPELLEALIPAVEAAEQADYCRPEATRSAAILRLRLAEQAVAEGERMSIDGRLAALRDSIRRSLACSPADPFLWVVLYWVESARNGFQPRYLDYLRLSYRLGPNEGWIGLKRNGLALAIFERLPPDIAELAISEFVGLLDTGFYPETAAILTGPGWRVRELLLPRLKDVNERYRQAFAREVYRQGYDVSVPGVPPRDTRPWD
jgi:hypothetical protein